jgi:P4 family phage/plasmid primase-like protien
VTGPYGQAARLYWDAGWPSPFPIVGKFPPPSGWTGYDGAWPDETQIDEWERSQHARNIALRMPDGVIGIDIDAYDGRNGLEKIEWYELNLDEPLPPTWTSTSRTDGSGSGIKFYRVPEGLNWKSKLEKDANVEIVRTGHRYAMVWPSVHPDTNQVYHWKTPDGEVTTEIPVIGEFTMLGPKWIEVLQTTAPTPGTESGADGTNHATDDEEVSHNGDVIDVDSIYSEGLPIGDQQNQLFAYFCSMRARRWRRVEMINAGMFVLQRMENDPNKAPWTPEGIVDIVDHVRRLYPAGMSSGMQGLGPGALAYAQRLAGGQGVTEINELPPREALATDMGNSMRMVQLLGDRIRYAVREDQWYVWDDVRWCPDDTNRVMELTKNVVDAIRGDAIIAEGDERTRWLNWARDSESLARRKAMIAGAESEPSLVINTTNMDSNPNILVVRNGTLDLLTGQLRESRREELCSHLAEVDYVEDAPFERWLSHVHFVCNGDPILMAYLQRAAGYSLTGNVGARSFFFMEGTGSNGKNAFVEPLMMVMGSYAKTATTALLTGGDEQHPTILADLQGARLVFIDETRQGKALNVERLKALTGSKRVKARKMNKNFYEFDAQFKLWIAGNGQPTIRDPSDGVWNRMHRVVCHGKIAPGKAIAGYGDLLYKEEASGILRWALEGLQGYRELGGLGIPDSIKQDVQSYRDEEDYVGQFIEDVLIRTGNSGDALFNKDLYAAYERWAVEHGLRGVDKLNAAVLGKALVGHGIERPNGPISINKEKGRGYRGIKFRDGTTAWLNSLG